MVKLIPLSERIIKAIRFLIRIANTDGGIPAVKPGEPSGCWTTAETLEAILRSPWFHVDLMTPIAKMTGFLLRTQIKEETDSGGWPLVVGAKHPSAMATAHSILALSLARSFLKSKDSLITDSINAGVVWLKKFQSPSGGWGLEPSGGLSGREPRVVSTFLALRALSQLGEVVHSSRCARSGVDFLWSLYDGNGFGPALGRPSDACSTARAFLAIRDAGALDEHENFVSRTLSFISSCKPKDRLWDLDNEVYVPDGAAGQIVFNNNSTAELLEFFVNIDTTEGQQIALVKWFQQNQRDDGSWCLGANNRLLTDLVTWPTNEAILTLSLFLREVNFERPIVPGLQQNSPIQPTTSAKSFLLWMFASIAILEAIMLLGAPKYLEKTWIALPLEYRNTFWWASVFAIAINLISTSIVWLFRRTLERNKKK